MKNTIKMVAAASLFALQLNAVVLVENETVLEEPAAVKVQEKSIIPVLAQASKTVAWAITSVIIIKYVVNKELTNSYHWKCIADGNKKANWAMHAVGILGAAAMVVNIGMQLANTVQKIKTYRNAVKVKTAVVAE